MRTVLVDLFGTLVGPFPRERHRHLLARMADLLGLPGPAFIRHFEATVEESISGRMPTVMHHVKHVASLLAAPVDEEALAAALALHEATTRDWLAPRRGAIAALRSLRRQGVRLGLVSNCSSEVIRLWPATPMAPLVDEALFSCAEGLAKPDVRLFGRALARLGAAPDETAFVSDGPVDELEAAASVGIVPILFDAPDLDPGRLAGRSWPGWTVTAFAALPSTLNALSSTPATGR